MRAKRISTEENDLKQALENLKKGFQDRGYKEAQVEEQFVKIQQIQREDLLTYSDNKEDHRLKFITKYNRNLPDIRTIINDNWSILATNDKLAKTFKDKPILTFQRNKNLKDLIGGNKLQNNQKVTRMTAKCGHCGPCLSQIGNICCKQIISTNSFNSAKTGEKFQIKHRVNCKTNKNLLSR